MAAIFPPSEKLLPRVRLALRPVAFQKVLLQLVSPSNE
jgi:hypothetical protein